MKFWDLICHSVYIGPPEIISEICPKPHSRQRVLEALPQHVQVHVSQIRAEVGLSGGV